MYRAWAAALILALLLSACGSTSQESQPGNGKWRVSDVEGSVRAGDRIRLQDDFAAAANQSLLENAVPGSGSFSDVMETVHLKKKALLEGELSDGSSRELKKYADLASGWDERNADGAEPLRPYLEAIESISSIEELTAYQCSREKNPFCLGVLMPLEAGQSGIEPAVCTEYIGFPELTLEGEGEYTSLSAKGVEKRDAVNRRTEHVLGKLGYSGEKIQKLLKGCYRFEKKLAHAVTFLGDSEKKKTLMDREGCISASGGYPIGEILNAWGYPADGSYTMNAKEAKKAAALYSMSNLEDIKGMLTVHLVEKSTIYLDRETFDLENELSVSRLVKKKDDIPKTKEQEELSLLFDVFLSSGIAGIIMDRMYVNAYADDETVKELEQLTSDILGQFRSLLEEESWLSEEGREACLKKLDALRPHVVIPDFDRLDYSGFHVRSREEGGNFLDAVAASELCLQESETGLCRQPYDRTIWNPANSSTTQTNAYYTPTENCIYILMGMLEPPFYSPDMSYEQKLGGIGAVIGHEITHGFDNNGSEYNGDGIEDSWLPYTDRLTFSDRCDKVAEYYRTIRPFSGGGAYDGSRVTAEATADMGGLRITLALAKKKEGFDYDAYFRQYAKIWFKCEPEDRAVALFDTDEHPLAYLRVNVGLQQFDEFQKTYGIKKGDGMYLMEEKRIAVW